MREPDARIRDQRLRALVDKFGKGLNVTAPILEAAVRQSMQDPRRDAAALDLRAADGFLARVALAVSSVMATDGKAQADQLQSAIEPATLTTPMAALPEAGATQEADRKALLNAGIQDITNVLVSNYQVNDILRIILEVMCRSMGFTRVLLCVRDPSSNTLKARFGFGANVDEIMRKGFGIPLGGARDVFQAAIANSADILIEDEDLAQSGGAGDPAARNVSRPIRRSGRTAYCGEQSLQRRNHALPAHRVPVTFKMHGFRCDGAALFSPRQQHRTHRLRG